MATILPWAARQSYQTAPIAGEQVGNAARRREGELDIYLQRRQLGVLGGQLGLPVGGCLHCLVPGFHQL